MTLFNQIFKKLVFLVEDFEYDVIHYLMITNNSEVLEEIDELLFKYQADEETVIGLQCVQDLIGDLLRYGETDIKNIVLTP